MSVRARATRRHGIVLLVDWEACNYGRGDRFVLPRHSAEWHVQCALTANGHATAVVPFTADLAATLQRIATAQPALIFNLTEAIDGDRSRDAAIAGVLALLDCPFTGSGAWSLAICRDKALSKQVVARLGIEVPDFIVASGAAELRRHGLRFPLIVKPRSGDGGDGISRSSRVADQQALVRRVEWLARRLHTQAICEEFVAGRDLYVSLLADRRGVPQPMPPMELHIGRQRMSGPQFATDQVRHNAAYRTRWRVRWRRAKLSAELLDRVRRAARQAFDALGMRDYGRVDFRLAEDAGSSSSRPIRITIWRATRLPSTSASPAWRTKRRSSASSRRRAGADAALKETSRDRHAARDHGNGLSALLGGRVCTPSSALHAVMARAEVDHLLIVTDHRSGNGPQWVTGWPGTVEAYVVFSPSEPMTMFVEWFNHLPMAQKLAVGVDVRWGEHRGIALAIEALARRGAKRIGVMGPLVVSKWRQLEARFTVLGLDAEYARLRMIKSAEEIDWLRIGAALSDAGFAALLAGTRPGLTERELGNLVERAWVPHGGTTLIHYIARTAMADPQLFVPPQHHSPRRVARGDILFCELSALWWDYAGQILRTFCVDAEPTPLYRDLHATAEAIFDAVTAEIRPGATMQALLDATGLAEQRGFSVCDDVVHGFGGGYWPPILGSRSRMAGPLPDLQLAENMCLVVQPNVISLAHNAGVQTGELLRVTATGCEILHHTPRGLLQAGQII